MHSAEKCNPRNFLLLGQLFGSREMSGVRGNVVLKTGECSSAGVILIH